MFRRRLTGLVLLGLLVRLAAAYASRAYPVQGDALTFHVWAQHLSAGEGFRRVFEDVPTAEHPPLHGVVLAVADLAGLDSTAAQKAFMGLVGCLTVAGCGLLGRRVAGDRAGLLAAAIAAVYPMLWLADVSLMSESTYGAVLVGVALAAYGLLDRPGPRGAALLGALVALAALTRGEGIGLVVLLLVPVAVLAARSAREGVRLLAVGFAAFLLVLAPWTVRNALTFDAPVLVSTNGNGVWAGANCPATYGGPLIGSWVFACYGPLPPGDEAEQSVVYRERGLSYLQAHAGRLPAVLVARLGRQFDVLHPLGQGLFLAGVEGRRPQFQRLGVLAWWVLAPLALAGLVVLRRRGEPVVVMLAPWVLVVLVGLFVYGSTRLRFAVEPSAVVLAAVTLDAALRARASRRPAAAPAG